jgi:acyl-CoA thioester hydrolase
VNEPLPEQAASYPVRRPMSTRWRDNDAYGHVNNAVYYEYFDAAVNGWLMDATGVDIRALPAIGVVAETSCRYLRQLSFPEPVEIGIGVERLGTTSVVYRLAVFAPARSDSAQPHATGRFVHVYVDALTRRPVPVPDPIRGVVRNLIAAAPAGDTNPSNPVRDAHQIGLVHAHRDQVSGNRRRTGDI